MISLVRGSPPSSHGGRAARRDLGLSSALRGVGQPDHAPRLVAIAVAAVLHAALAAVAARLPEKHAAPVHVTEVELAAPPEPPPPPPPPSPAPVEPHAAEAPAPTPSSAPPPVARAGNVVTARSDSPLAPSDAVDFVTDPDGKTFGSGVVARGGTADRATQPAHADATPAPPPRGPAGPRRDAVTAPENLSRAARLEEANPCAGFYPRGASADTGQATLSLVVRPGGDLASTAVVSESPAGEGFGAAARACLAKKTFSPALDRGGMPVTAALSIRVRFTR